MSYLLKYSQWRALFEKVEQEPIDKENTTTTDGPSQEEEEKLKEALISKLTADTGAKVNVVGKIRNLPDGENILNGVLEAFISSKTTPKEFFDSEKNKNYKFSVSPAAYGGMVNAETGEWVGPKQTGTLKLSEPGKIPYIGLDGKEVVKSSIDEIVSEINLANTNLFKEDTGGNIGQKLFNKTTERQWVLVQHSIPNENKKIKPRIVLKAVLTKPKSRDQQERAGLITVLPGIIPITSKGTKVTAGSQKTVIKKATEATAFTIKADLPIGEDSTKTTTFDSGKAVLKNPTDTQKLIDAAITKQITDALTAKGLPVDMNTVELTSIKVICSASNTYGGLVTATHDNAGNPTGKAYSDVPPSRAKDANYATQAQTNYNLAVNRGEALKAVVNTVLTSKGFSGTLPEVQTEPRVTDTGGVADTDKKGNILRNTQIYPKPGQYARVEISAKTVETKMTEPTPEVSKESVNYTQFQINIIEEAGKSLFDNIFGKGWELSKAKYLKRSGAWKSAGAIKRNSGNNKAFTGLSHFVHNLIYK